MAVTAVTENGLVLKHMGEKLRKSSDVVFQAINNNALSLEFADDHFKNDKDTVMNAI